MFATATGRALSASNVPNRVLAPAVERGYARVRERRDREAEKLAALVGERATTGNNSPSNGQPRPLATEPEL